MSKLKVVGGEIREEQPAYIKDFEVQTGSGIFVEFILRYQYGTLILHSDKYYPRLDHCAESFIERQAHTPINRKTFDDLAAELEWRLQKEALWIT